MLHDLLDKKVYIVELYCLKHWSRFNLGEIDEVLAKEGPCEKNFGTKNSF